MPVPPGPPAPKKPPSEAPILSSARGIQSALRAAGPFAAASYTLIGAIVLLGFLGRFADNYFGTSPWLLIVGLFLGIVVGFYEIARVAWRQRP